ncbi:hypothetical protein [Brevundimonas sp.]|uniref:hypothetical protein n=1 Tax=Brevundimonas sp. TaxID=1871086 RepID=UPI0027FEE69F|nr:hypothetical protein [Brevundimonas sp.]MDQ7812746.1 hypothetical protein [Brevundimonas sp.]
MRANHILPVVLSGLLLASSAQAQVPGGGGGAPAGAQGSTGGAIGRMTGQQESWRFESEEMRRRNAMTPEEAEAEYGAERVALANRVQALIDEGKCREARAMANEAGERQMALRIRQTCRAR